MREEYTPGDLSVRLSFPTTMNTLDGDRIRPSLEIVDQTSGRAMQIDLTSDQLVRMLSGGSASVSADQVSGFRGLDQWGKYLGVTSRAVPTRSEDYKFKGDPASLPQVAEAIRELEAEGFTCDAPRRNNASQWIIVGRRYTDQPEG